MAWKAPKTSEVPVGSIVPVGGRATRGLDPFSAMRAEVDRVFDSFLGRGASDWLDSPSNRLAQIVAPDVDVRETDKEIIIEAELPGMSEDDVSITLRGGVMTISGEKKSERDEEKDTYHLVERSYGSFDRSFRLPDTVDEDQIQASFNRGVLRVVAPKHSEAIAAEKTIPIGKQ
jgi:HSP20 family protein